jgi:hypothetical protein
MYNQPVNSLDSLVLVKIVFPLLPLPGNLLSRLRNLQKLIYIFRLFHSVLVHLIVRLTLSMRWQAQVV